MSNRYLHLNNDHNLQERNQLFNELRSFNNPINIMMLGDIEMQMQFIKSSLLIAQPFQTDNFIDKVFDTLRKKSVYVIELGIASISLISVPDFPLDDRSSSKIIDKLLDGVRPDVNFPINKNNEIDRNSYQDFIDQSKYDFYVPNKVMFFINQSFIQNLPNLEQLSYILNTIKRDTGHPATIIAEYDLLSNKELLDCLNIIPIDCLIGGLGSYTRDDIINFGLDWLNIIAHGCKTRNTNYNSLICRNIKQIVNNGKEYDLQNCRGQIVN